MIRRAHQITETHHDRTVTITGRLVGSYGCAGGVTLVVQVGRETEIEINKETS